MIRNGYNHSQWKITENKIEQILYLTSKAPNTTIADFAKTVDPDETAHLDLQCLPSSLWFFNIIR